MNPDQMRPANHADEIADAMRLRDEQAIRDPASATTDGSGAEKLDTGQDGGYREVVAGVPDLISPDSFAHLRNYGDKAPDLAGARHAKMIELAMKHHRMECLAHDLVDLLRTIERMHPEGSYPHEKLDVRIRNAEQVITENQIL